MGRGVPVTRLTVRQQRGIVRAFAEGKSVAVLALVWDVPVARIEALLRTAMTKEAQ